MESPAYQSSAASAATARQDGLPGGVASSQKMARTELPRLKKNAGGRSGLKIFSPTM